MAGLITHMVVAREMMKLLPEGTIKDDGLFYLGTLAPDAIHVREGYVRAFKKHTHLRDDIPDKDFALEDSLSLFHKRVSDFIMKNREREDNLLDLYRGYVVHLLTDELFILTIRTEFCELMEKLDVTQEDTKFYEDIVTDMHRNDYLLVENYKEMNEIRKQLEQVRIYEILDYLTDQEIEKSRDWLINRHFVETNELKEPVYISYERTMNFIKMAAADITTRLSGEGDLPRMF